MPQLRKDPVVGRWVIIATERSRRPTNFEPVRPAPAASFCPFCPGEEEQTPPEVYAVRSEGQPDSEGWEVRVVPNKFPALQIEGDLNRRAEGLFDVMNGIAYRHDRGTFLLTGKYWPLLFEVVFVPATQQ